MTEYITKEQAIHAMEQVTQPECFIEDTRKNFAKIIEKLPAADVAPVVNARWEWITENLYKCSHCHTKTLVDEFLNKTLYMYCPYCGARMDGGERDAD